MNRPWPRWPAVGLVVLASVTLASAGTVIVRTGNDQQDPVPCAGIAASDGNGEIWSAGGCDDDGDGIIVFFVPLAIQNATDSFVVSKDLEDSPSCPFCGEPVGHIDLVSTGRYQFDKGAGYTMAMAEPFQTETFPEAGGTVPVVASINVQPYLSGPSPFTSCGSFAVSNGTTSLTPHVTFKNASSLSTNHQVRASQVLNAAVFNALPNFTGNVRACDPLLFLPAGSPIPALDTWGVLALGLSAAGVAIWLLRRAV